MRNPPKLKPLLFVSALIGVIVISALYLRPSEPHPAPSTNLSTSSTQSPLFPPPPGTKTTSQTVSTTLTDAQKTELLSDLTQVFTNDAVVSLDKDFLKEKLSKLNSHGESSIRYLGEQLAESPTNDAEVPPRIAMVDYLVYRSKFDPIAKNTIVSILTLPIGENISPRYKAVVFADRAELFAGLSGIDWETAAKILAQVKEPILRELMEAEGYHRLVGLGTDPEYASKLLKEVNPSFKIPS